MKKIRFFENENIYYVRMEKFTITFGRDEAISRFLREAFSVNGSETTETVNAGGGTVVSVETTAGVLRTVLSETVVIFCKNKVLSKAFPENRKGVLYGAFMGALLGQEFEDEKETVCFRLPESKDFNIDGIFTFLLADLDYSWRALGVLANRLFTQCREEEDIFALIKYFLGGEILSGRTLVLDDGIYYDDNNEDLPCARVTGDDETDTALNLLLRKPTEIIVPTPKKYSDKLIGVIKKLGE